jgi:hypothetical protein
MSKKLQNAISAKMKSIFRNFASFYLHGPQLDPSTADVLYNWPGVSDLTQMILRHTLFFSPLSSTCPFCDKKCLVGWGLSLSASNESIDPSYWIDQIMLEDFAFPGYIEDIYPNGPKDLSYTYLSR